MALVDEYDKPILDNITGAATARGIRARGEPIHLIGVEFSQAERGVVGFEVERLD